MMKFLKTLREGRKVRVCNLEASAFIFKRLETKSWEFYFVTIHHGGYIIIGLDSLWPSILLPHFF
jgi:hypothetical protein